MGLGHEPNGQGLRQREVGFGVQGDLRTDRRGNGDSRRRRSWRRCRSRERGWGKTLPSRERPLGLEYAAEFGVRGDAPGDEDRARVLLLGGGQRAGNKIVHDAVLEARDQIQGGLRG